MLTDSLGEDSNPDGINLPGVKKCILGKLWITAIKIGVKNFLINNSPITIRAVINQ